MCLRKYKSIRFADFEVKAIKETVKECKNFIGDHILKISKGRFCYEGDY